MVPVSVRYGQASHCRCILSLRLHTVSLSPSHGRYSVRYYLKLVAVVSWRYSTLVQHALVRNYPVPSILLLLIIVGTLSSNLPNSPSPSPSITPSYPLPTLNATPLQHTVFLPPLPRCPILYLSLDPCLLSLSLEDARNPALARAQSTTPAQAYVEGQNGGPGNGPPVASHWPAHTAFSAAQICRHLRTALRKPTGHPASVSSHCFARRGRALRLRARPKIHQCRANPKASPVRQQVESKQRVCTGRTAGRASVKWERGAARTRARTRARDGAGLQERP
ncbi:hypothetical protein VTO73DRAFT_8154 [Trametes versicolor]